MSDAPRAKPMLLVGATSGLARAIAEQLAQAGHDLLLAGRDRDELAALAADLRLRFAVRTAEFTFDATDFASHGPLFEQAVDRCDDPLAGVILCHGYMATQADAEADPAEARRMIDVNYCSYVALLEPAARYFQSQGQGTIVALSSVAGDRGRPSNYLYGSTKAALNTCLAGLRARLVKTNVHVLTVKPGPVDTAMTWGLKATGPPATPDRVGRDVLRALRRRRRVLYTPWFWRPIMAVIRAIPEPIFNRLKL
ncbi:MAG: SDR family oxidoreductase [Phycisphaeraceae bacterium]